MQERTFAPMPIEVDFIVKWLYDFHNSYPFVGGLFIMILLDVCSGLIAAYITESVSSAASYKGMSKKVMMILVVGLAAAFEPYSGGIALAKMTAMCYMVSEAISITENAARCHVPLPQKLLNVLAAIKSGEKSSTNLPQVSSVTNIERANKVDVHTSETVTTKKKNDPEDGTTVTVQDAKPKDR